LPISPDHGQRGSSKKTALLSISDSNYLIFEITGCLVKIDQGSTAFSTARRHKQGSRI